MCINRNLYQICFYYAPEGTSGGILKSYRPSVCPSIRQSVRPLQIVSQRYLINYWSKFDETSQKDKAEWEGLLRTWFRFMRPRSRSQSGQRSKSFLSNNSKTVEANLMKLHRKIEHNEKVCCTQELGSYAQGQGHSQVKGQIVPKIVLLFNYWSKFDETSQKDKA